MHPNTATLRVTWTAGPDAGGVVALHAGRHVVGRAPDCALVSHDRALDAHHAIIDVTTDDEGRPTLTMTPLSRHVASATSTRLELGDSVLQLSGASDAPVRLRPPGPVLRRPRPTPCAPVVPVTAVVDTAGPFDTTVRPAGAWVQTLVPSLVGLIGALAVAAITGQVMFAVFGALGSLVGVAGWAGTYVVDRRQRHLATAAERRRRAEVETNRARYRDALVEHHHQTTRNLPGALDAIHSEGGPLWERRPDHVDAWTVGLGVGEIPWPDPDTVERGYIGTVAATFGPGSRTAVVGEPSVTAPMIRSVLVQLMANVGPSDLRVVVVTRAADSWAWLAAAPHVRYANGRCAIVSERELPDVIRSLSPTAGGPHVVVVSDGTETLVERSAPLRRALANGEHALLVGVPPGAAVPHVCTAELQLGRNMRARWAADLTRAGLPTLVHAAGLLQRRAAAAVGVLGTCDDPDDIADDGRHLPDLVELSTLIGRPTSEAVLARWSVGGNDPAPRAAIGVHHRDHGVGECTIDLATDGPHALVAGTTGAGKSELLRTLVLGLAAASPPDLLHFALIDFKGGATFDGLAALPHVVGVVTDLDGGLLDRCLRSLAAEVRRREEALRESGARDLTEHRRAGRTNLARLVVVVDEFAALAVEHADRLATLLSIAQRGRSLGLHLVLATQRPSGVINDQIRANTALRIALRVHDVADATDVVGESSPAHFARSLAGRATIRLDGQERTTVQTAFAADAARWVTAITEAAHRHGAPGVTPLWTPPLPATCSWNAGDGARVGWVDDADGGPHRPLHIPDGHLAVIGGTAVDRRATLDTLIRSARVAGRDVYVVGTSFGIGGVETVAADDVERRLRLARRAVNEPMANDPLIVVDDVSTMRRAWDHDPFDEHAHWTELLRHRRVRVVVAVAHPADLPTTWTSSFGERWVLPLADAHDAASLGVRATDAPTTDGGRCVIVSSGLPARTAVVARWDEALMLTGHPPTTPIHRLPSLLEGDEPTVADADSVRLDDHVLLTIGLTADLGPAAMELGDGEHALVLGPPRSGRSTALARMIEQWELAHDDVAALTVVLAPRRSSLRHDRTVRTVDDLCATADVDPDTYLLIVVDDAEQVDDPRLTALAARPRCTVFAAANATALRQQYGHWTGIVRRSQTGLVLTRADRMDAELLGAVVARDVPLSPRPGLAWLVQQASATLVQIAVPAAPTHHRPRLALA